MLRRLLRWPLPFTTAWRRLAPTLRYEEPFTRQQATHHHQHRGFTNSTAERRTTVVQVGLSEIAKREVSHWTSTYQLPWLLNPPDNITAEFIRTEIKTTLQKQPSERVVMTILMNVNNTYYRQREINEKYETLYNILGGYLRPLFMEDVHCRSQFFCKFATPFPGCYVVGTVGADKKIFQTVLDRLAAPFQSESVTHIQEVKRVNLFDPDAGPKRVPSPFWREREWEDTRCAGCKLQQSDDLPPVHQRIRAEHRDIAQCTPPHQPRGWQPLRRGSARACQIPSPPQEPFLEGRTVHLVVDELGQQPNRLLMLIRHSPEIRRGIADYLMCNSWEVLISCLGTGVKDSSEVLGSDSMWRQLGPSEHNRHKHSEASLSDENVLVKLFRQMSTMNLTTSDVDAVRSFSKSPLIAPLLDNYRAAVLVASHVLQVQRSTQQLLSFSLPNTVEQCTNFVAQQFRMLSGLGYLQPKQLLPCCAHAFRLALCGPIIQTSSCPQQLSVEEAMLISTLGILTEQCKIPWLPIKRKNDPRPLTTVGLPCFKLSRSAALMMLTDFGTNRIAGISPQSGGGLEFAIVQKAVLTFRCCRSADEVRQVLQCAEPRKSAADTLAALSKAARNAPTATLLKHVSNGTPPTASTGWTSGEVILRTPRTRLEQANRVAQRGQRESKGTRKKAKQERKTKTTTKSERARKDDPPVAEAGYLNNLELLHKIKRDVDAGKRVVVLNDTSCKGAYVDVILVAQGFLCLVHCKQQQQTGRQYVDGEMKNMLDHNKDITDCLCHIACVHPSDITVLLPTTAGKTHFQRKERRKQQRGDAFMVATCTSSDLRHQKGDTSMCYFLSATPTVPPTECHSFAPVPKMLLGEISDQLDQSASE